MYYSCNRRILVVDKNANASIIDYSMLQNTKSRAVYYSIFSDSRIDHFVPLSDDRDVDLYLKTDKEKAIVFNTSILPLSEMEYPCFIPLMQGHRHGGVKEFSLLTDANINESERYRVNSLPAIGYYIV